METRVSNFMQLHPFFPIDAHNESPYKDYIETNTQGNDTMTTRITKSKARRQRLKRIEALKITALVIAAPFLLFAAACIGHAIGTALS